MSRLQQAPLDLRPSEPARLQRRRSKGWRMPEGAIYVGRPTRWGNPFVIGLGPGEFTAEAALRLFRMYAQDSRRGSEWLDALVGRDLVCWCALDRPCHADILLELANDRG